jgi:hypothetical protein
LLLGVWPIEHLAEFTTVNFGAFADQLFNFPRIVVPALEVPGAKLALRIFLIAGALFWLARLYLRCSRFSLRGGRIRDCRRRCGGLVRQKVLLYAILAESSDFFTLALIFFEASLRIIFCQPIPDFDSDIAALLG